MHEPATSPRSTFGPAGTLWRAVLAGVTAGLIGTTMHASISYVGDTPIVWGAAFAWLLLGVLVYWAAVSTQKLWAGAVAGILCYVLVGVIAVQGNDTLIVPFAVFGQLPGPALASTLWAYGMIVPMVVGLVLALRRIRRG